MSKKVIYSEFMLTSISFIMIAYLIKAGVIYMVLKWKELIKNISNNVQ